MFTWLLLAAYNKMRKRNIDEKWIVQYLNKILKIYEGVQIVLKKSNTQPQPDSQR